MNGSFFVFSPLSCIQTHPVGQQLIFQLRYLYDLSISYNLNAAVCTSVTLFLKISKLISQQLFCPPELSMPCDQYELHLENSVVAPNENQDVPVASLDQSTSIVTAVQLGHINVVLDHKSILLENQPPSPPFFFLKLALYWYWWHFLYFAMVF